MTFEEINEVEDINSYFETFDVKKVNDHYSINELVALPILTSYSFNRNSDIIIKTKRGTEIGKILFLKDSDIKDIRSLPEEKLICFFKDHDSPQISEEKYTFKNDYLLIKKRNFNSYNKNKKLSALWGSFFHIEELPSISFEKRNSLNEIRIITDLKIENPIYFENLLLSINEPNPFNRFLKLYHLIELQFDMHTAEKIVELHRQGKKEKEISNLLKEYQREDLNRLTSIIRQRCTNIENLVICLNKIKPFKEKAKKLFYDYGRESNPLNKQSDFNKILDNPDLFSESVINSIGGFSHSILIPKICSYWIYRIRSSISHNKFGEYIMDKNDEEFIVEFGEPLLKELVIQCFKK